MKSQKNLLRKQTILVIFLAILLTAIAFYQVFLKNKIPLNGNCLVTAYSPFIFEKWPNYPTGVPFKPGILDQLRIYYPYLRLTRDQWKNFQLPIWNPYNFAGNPHMAEWQSGTFYPFHIVSFFLSLQNHWIFMILSPFILTFIFTYLYLKNLKLDFRSSIFGSLSFAFCGFMITWSQEVMTASHSIMWFPLFLLSLDKFISENKKGWWLIGITASTLSFLSGYWQTTFYFLCLSALYAAVKILSLKKEAILKLKLLFFTSLIFIIGILLAAPQIIPTLELFNLSAKKTVEFSQTLISYLLPWRQLITFFAPDFFGHPVTRNEFGFQTGSYYERILFVGIIPLFFALFSLTNLSDKKNRNQILFFLLSGILFLIPIFDTPISRILFTIKIPLLSTVIANRTMFINAFCLSVLSAYGVELWLKNKKSNIKSFFAVFSFFALAYGLILFVLYQASRGKFIVPEFPSNWYTISFRNLAIPMGFFLVSSVLILLKIVKKKDFLFWSIFALAFLHQFYFLQKFTPFSDRKFAFPHHETIEFLQKKAEYDRFLGNNGIFLENNFATLYKIYSPTGYDSLNNNRYSEFLYAAGSDGKIVKQRPSRSDAILPRDFHNPLLQKMAAILSIRYIIDHPKMPHRIGEDEDLKNILKDKIELVFNHDFWKIYEYKEAIPRVFLAENFVVETDPQRIVDLLLSSNLDLKKTIVLEEKPKNFPQKTGPKGKAEIIDYQPNIVRIKTESSFPKLLYFSDSFYPGWQATVDNVKTKIYRANYAFRSIVVPEGKHEVIFSYHPQSLKIGFYTSLGGLILVLSMLKIISFKN